MDERLDLQAELLAQMDETDAGADGGDVESIYFLLGLPGSGKSSSLRPIAVQHAGLGGVPPVVDADAVRVRFPEYADGLGSGVVQAETAVLTYGRGYRWGEGRQGRVLLGGAPVIMLDTIGDAEHLPRTIARAVELGRRVYVLRTDCPVEVCRERAMRRALDNRRVVPLELIDAKAGVPEHAFEAAVATGVVDGWAVVNTAGETADISSASADFAAMTIAEVPA
ncbi:zeta toxin family protein [Nocardioides sp. Leaf285]|uniref:zeta toxin family protein n=1 Tax=Nocardioides sp. Leaf285 TaxID=1736322 RepID=UPI000702A4DE|nr:zeta toxin family protein [Nocardioides sp. Leaf285]KQP63742.1 hypothetical protein ASF47_17285 [Nocardioides sp. Leaf285]